MKRRTFLSVAASLAALDAGAQPAPIPIIDTHIHLFDIHRPEGVPWPPKDNKALYHTALPTEFRALTKGLDVVGAIEVECSPRLEDNQWVLDVAARDSIIVGTVGDLEAGKPGFRQHLERFHRNPLFRGIRCGNLWGRDLSEQISDQQFVSDIRALADADLGMDSANPDAKLISALLRLIDKVPELRIVVDHLPQLVPPGGAKEDRQLNVDLRELAARPNVFFKLSAVLRPVDGRVPLDLDFYRSRLEELWGTFGEDRVLYGSDWPNSDTKGTYTQGFDVIHQFVSGKSRAAQEKFFWKNSVKAYGWVKRTAEQPQLT